MFSSRDRAQALEAARGFLEADPAHNVLLLEALCHPQPDAQGQQFWWVVDGGPVVGFVARPSSASHALASPMDAASLDAVVAQVATAAPDLAGVSADAATAAALAGRWTDLTDGSAVPSFAQRLYEATNPVAPPPTGGRARLATEGEAPELIAWLDQFGAETGDPVPDAEWFVRRRLSEQALWVWDDGGPVSMTARTAAVAGVNRVQAVYTPPSHRQKHYAANLVAALTAAIGGEGLRAMLYTDLANAASNAMYRALGYRAVVEVTRYRFTRPGR
ncbi:GNAT family N-acetyltransferase [Candidatus Poriferisocius sp.]|uniref:GNAT family N-acetyltransferase n=1 Tax=Candidatus Poriferisocius sp. TaxID=3101276 RepID=UPI003B591D0B